MISEFITAFESLGSASSFIQDLESFVENLSEEYFKDGNARNAFIDEVISYLETLKTTTPAAK